MCEIAEVKSVSGVEYYQCKIDGAPCHHIKSETAECCYKKEVDYGLQEIDRTE